MFEFLVTEDGLQAMRVFAIGRKEALSAASAAGFSNPTIRLMADASGTTARNDLVDGVLIVSSTDGNVLSYLRQHRFTYKGSSVRHPYSPFVEDIILHEIGVEILPVWSSLLAYNTREYWSEYAKHIAARQSFDDRTLYRQIARLARERSGWRARRRAHGVFADRWASYLDTRISCLSAIYAEIQGGVQDILKVLHSNDLVRVGDEWYVVKRVNEKTIRAASKDLALKTFTPDRVDEWKSPPASESSDWPVVDPGDYVYYGGHWLRVESVGERFVKVRSKFGGWRRLPKSSISQVMGKEEMINNGFCCDLC